MGKTRIALITGLIVLGGTGYAFVKNGVFRGSGYGFESPTPTSTPSLPPVIPQTRTESDARVLELSRRYCRNAYEVTCESATSSTKDPTGKVDLQIAGEVRALRVLRKIMGNHPDWNSKQVEAELVKAVYTEKRLKRIEAAFKWVKEQLLAIIEKKGSEVFSDAEKASIVERISRVELDMPPPASKYSDAADLFTKNSIYYERTPKNILRLRVGGAYLMNISSWFNLVFSLAHEFSHAIDPCEMAVNSVRPQSYEGLVACFVRSGWVEASRSQCGGNEQVSEVFSDWMASEVLSSALINSEKDYTLEQRIQAAINSVRDLCEEPVGIDTFSEYNHPSPNVRIQKLFGRNPKIRKSVGCTSVFNEPFCDFSHKKERK